MLKERVCLSMVIVGIDSDISSSVDITEGIPKQGMFERLRVHVARLISSSISFILQELRKISFASEHMVPRRT
jgi:hypothetical protein